MNVGEHYHGGKDRIKAGLKRAGEKVANGVILTAAPLVLGAAALRETVVEFPSNTDIGLEPSSSQTPPTYNSARGILTVPDLGTATGKIGDTEWVVEDFRARPGKKEARGQIKWGQELKLKGGMFFFGRLDGIETAFKNARPRKLNIGGVNAAMRYYKGFVSRK